MLPRVHLARQQQLERREPRTPTAAQYRTILQQSTGTGNPSATCVCWTNCSSSSFFKLRLLWKAKKNTSEQTMRSQQHAYMWIVPRCRKQRQRSKAVADTTQASEAETAGWGSRASHGRMYLILGGASPRRVPLESAEVRFCPRPQFYQQSVVVKGACWCNIKGDIDYRKRWQETALSAVDRLDGRFAGCCDASGTSEVNQYTNTNFRIPGSAHPERHTDRPWGVERRGLQVVPHERAGVLLL